MSVFRDKSNNINAALKLSQLESQREIERQRLMAEALGRLAGAVPDSIGAYTNMMDANQRRDLALKQEGRNQGIYDARMFENNIAKNRLLLDDSIYREGPKQIEAPQAGPVDIQAPGNASGAVGGLRAPTPVVEPKRPPGPLNTEHMEALDRLVGPAPAEAPMAPKAVRVPDLISPDLGAVGSGVGRMRKSLEESDPTFKTPKGADAKLEIPPGLDLGGLIDFLGGAKAKVKESQAMPDGDMEHINFSDGVHVDLSPKKNNTPPQRYAKSAQEIAEHRLAIAGVSPSDKEYEFYRASLTQEIDSRRRARDFENEDRQYQATKRKQDVKSGDLSIDKQEFQADRASLIASVDAGAVAALAKLPKNKHKKKAIDAMVDDIVANNSFRVYDKKKVKAYIGSMMGQKSEEQIKARLDRDLKRAQIKLANSRASAATQKSSGNKSLITNLDKDINRLRQRISVLTQAKMAGALSRDQETELINLIAKHDEKMNIVNKLSGSSDVFGKFGVASPEVKLSAAATPASVYSGLSERQKKMFKNAEPGSHAYTAISKDLQLGPDMARKVKGLADANYIEPESAVVQAARDAASAAAKAVGLKKEDAQTKIDRINKETNKLKDSDLDLLLRFQSDDSLVEFARKNGLNLSVEDLKYIQKKWGRMRGN